MPRLNGKFVSKEKYEAAMAAEKYEAAMAAEKKEVEPVGLSINTEETEAEVKPRKTRTVDPITAATARVRKARRELDRVAKIHAKRKELPSLEDAQAEYDAATSALQDALNV